MKPPLYVRPLEDAERDIRKAGLHLSEGFAQHRIQIALISARKDVACHRSPTWVRLLGSSQSECGLHPVPAPPLYSPGGTRYSHAANLRQCLLAHQKTGHGLDQGAQAAGQAREHCHMHPSLPVAR